MKLICVSYTPYNLRVILCHGFYSVVHDKILHYVEYFTVAPLHWSVSKFTFQSRAARPVLIQVATMVIDMSPIASTVSAVVTSDGATSHNTQCLCWTLAS